MILATGKYVGEGFDDARLDTLVLTLPVSWRGTVAQYAGRLHRLCEGKKKVRIFDFADLNVPMLARMFDRRCQGYEAIGYQIVLPASAIPGWPADVVLPSDPVWKRDYAASVRRLVRDGIDVPLAQLFIQSARPTPIDAEGANRARSASEAFLHRRLETLNDTKGLSKSTFCCRSPSMVSAAWKWICCAPMLASRWRSTAPSISPIQSLIDGTAVRTTCFKSRDISCFASWRRTGAKSSISCSTASSER